jgi:hypothetical protein
MSNDSDTYIYPPTGEHLVRVTTVLDATHGKQRYLIPWAARLAAECAVDNLETLEAVLSGRAMNVASRESGRKAAVDLAKVRSAEVRDLKRDVGSYVHNVVEALILWQASPEGHGADLVLPELPAHLAGQYYDEDPVEIVAEWMVDGFLNWVADFKPQFLYAEMTVFNQPLGVAGTLDGVVWLPGLAIGKAGRFIPGDGVTVCDDVKTGKNPEVTWPEQVAAYRHAPEADPTRLGDLVPMPPTDAGMVVHLRPEYPRGYRVMLISAADDAEAWNTFRRDIEIFHSRKRRKAKPGKVCYPLRADGTIQQPLIADLDGEGYGRAISPLVKALGADADLEHLAAMTAGDLLKVKGIGGKILDVIRVMLADHGLHLADEAPELAKAA